MEFPFGAVMGALAFDKEIDREIDKEIELIDTMERLSVECRNEGARAKARSLARRHRQGLAEVALQL